MRNILTYGSYGIGSPEKTIFPSPSAAIQLRLKQSKTKRIHKLQYSFDEVKDLESKLVLITGRSRESTEKKEVDTFLRVSHKIKLVYIVTLWNSLISVAMPIYVLV